jgi:hypothetical protein
MLSKLRWPITAAVAAVALTIALFLSGEAQYVPLQPMAGEGPPIVQTVGTDPIALNSYVDIAQVIVDADVWAQSSAMLSIHNGQVGDIITIRALVNGTPVWLGDTRMGQTQWTFASAVRQYPLDNGDVMKYQVRVTRSGSGTVQLNGGQAWWEYVARTTTPPPTTAAPTTAGPPPTTAPPTTEPPASNVWPNPDNTGVPAGVTLTDWTGGATLAPGTYDGYRFPERMTVGSAGGVIIDNSHLLEGIDNWTSEGGRGFHIEDSTLGSSTSCHDNFVLGSTDFTATRVEVYGDDGIRVSERGWTTGQDQITIQDSYIRPCNASSLSHSDGLQANGTDGPATVVHNTFDMRGAVAYTAGVYWENTYRGGTITNNLFVGQGSSDYFGSSLGGSTGPLHVVQDNLYAAYGNYNRGDQCENITWGDNNRRATVDASYVVTPGVVVGCS